MPLKKLFMLDCDYFLDRLEQRHASYIRPLAHDISLTTRDSGMYLANSDLSVQTGAVGTIHVARSDAGDPRKRRELAAHASALWIGAKIFASTGKLDVFRGYTEKQRRTLGAYLLADAGLASWTPVKRAEEELPLCAIQFEMARIHGSLGKDKKNHTHLLDKESDDLKKLIALVEESASLVNRELNPQLDHLHKLLKSMPALHNVDARRRARFLLKLEAQKQKLVKKLNP